MSHLNNVQGQMLVNKRLTNRCIGASLAYIIAVSGCVASEVTTADAATPENIVYLRINVVDYNPKKLIDIAPEIARLTPVDGQPPASVFVGVAALVLPSTMIEIETIAAVP
jgi:enamine deaminase RidA (YjgF/YER057c/UK114 family)